MKLYSLVILIAGLLIGNHSFAIDIQSQINEAVNSANNGEHPTLTESDISNANNLLQQAQDASDAGQADLAQDLITEAKSILGLY